MGNAADAWACRLACIAKDACDSADRLDMADLVTLCRALADIVLEHVFEEIEPAVVETINGIRAKAMRGPATPPTLG